jgi:muramoyltetrapeptide carboxypeptidase LdcA involved in peptidoglycan recycling
LGFALHTIEVGVSLSGLDEVFAKEYDQILVEVIANPALPIVSNINFGHSYPRTILPYGAKIEIKENGTAIHFKEEIFDYLKSTD